MLGHVMRVFRAAIVVAVMSVAGTVSNVPVNAQAETPVEITEIKAPSGVFIKKSKKLKGDWEVIHRGEKTFIVFGDNFRAARGPDLKIFLSPKSVSEVSGKTAVSGSLNLGELKATKGGQEYEVPADVDLSDYGSVLVHCEAYAVLWGGGDL